jgi:hypothetical protein
MELVTGHIGWIEIVCGPMFSGKSEELRPQKPINALRRHAQTKPTNGTGTSKTLRHILNSNRRFHTSQSRHHLRQKVPAPNLGANVASALFRAASTVVPTGLSALSADFLEVIDPDFAVWEHGTNLQLAAHRLYIAR